MFSNLIFFLCCSEWIKAYFPFGPSSSPCNSISALLIRSDFLLGSLRFHIFLQNCFDSLAFGYVYVFVLFPSHAGRIFFRYFGMFCLNCLILSEYLFSLPSFTGTFWLISSSCIVCSYCVVLFFLSQHILVVFFLSKHFCLLLKLSYLCFQSDSPLRFWISVRVL